MGTQYNRTTIYLSTLQYLHFQTMASSKNIVFLSCQWACLITKIIIGVRTDLLTSTLLSRRTFSASKLWFNVCATWIHNSIQKYLRIKTATRSYTCARSYHSITINETSHVSNQRGNAHLYKPRGNRPDRSFMPEQWTVVVDGLSSSLLQVHPWTLLG